MKKNGKDGILKRELKEWGAAFRQVGSELEDGFKDFGTELLTGKAPKRQSQNVIYIHGSLRETRSRRR